MRIHFSSENSSKPTQNAQANAVAEPIACTPNCAKWSFIGRASAGANTASASVP